MSSAVLPCAVCTLARDWVSIVRVAKGWKHVNTDTLTVQCLSHDSDQMLTVLHSLVCIVVYGRRPFP